MIVFKIYSKFDKRLNLALQWNHRPIVYYVPPHGKFSNSLSKNGGWPVLKETCPGKLIYETNSPEHESWIALNSIADVERMKAKTKTKKNVRKFERLKFPMKQNLPNQEDDLSQLRKPIDTSLTSLRQVTELFETGSDEVKSILAYECGIIYECRVCQSLFRSLGNFISHKRVYCTGKFSVSCDKKAIGPSNVILHQKCVVVPEINLETKENCKNGRMTRSQVMKETSRKDLTSVVEMLQKKHVKNDSSGKSLMRIIADDEQVIMEVLESNKVAYQTVMEPMELRIDPNDLMKAQATELQMIFNRNTGILGPDGLLVGTSDLDKPTKSFPSFENDGEVESSSGLKLTCSICDTKFATKKTLTFHMKSLHTPHRMVYPCPCCDSLFTNPWGVYRHLFKVHKKTNEQVRKLRGQIQEKAYRTESTRAQEIESDCSDKKIIEMNGNTKINETEEWMAHLESDRELQRCGGCGKRFDRKAALLSHSQICLKRIAACNDASMKAKRQKVSGQVAVETSTVPQLISTPALVLKNNSVCVKQIISSLLPLKDVISIPKDNSIRLPNISSSVTITRLPQEPQELSNRSDIRVEGIETLSKDAWDKIGMESSQKISKQDIISTIVTTDKEMRDNNTPTSFHDIDKESSSVDDDPEIVFTKIEKSKTSSPISDKKKKKIGHKSLSLNESNKSSNTPLPNRDRPATSDDDRPVSSRVTAIERRIATIADLRKLRCIPCNSKFSNMAYLRRHMAVHINWNRYRCKICDFKCFEKLDCVAHCNKNHNTRNDRSIMANMIVEIEPDNDVDVAEKNVMKKRDLAVDASNPEVIDVTKTVTADIDDDYIAYSNGKVDCIENEYLDCYGSDEGAEKIQKENNELSKKGKLDEDPELRRMVMEVIFGSSVVTPSEISPENSKSSVVRNITKKRRNLSNSASTDIISNTSVRSIGFQKNDDRAARPTRNRSRNVDKDFIYDLDAVLLQEKVLVNKIPSSVPEPLCNVETQDGKKNNANSMNIMNYESSDNLPVVILRGKRVGTEL